MNPFELMFGADKIPSLEKEREALLKKAYALETKMARRLIERKEYNEIRSAIHTKLTLVNLEKSVEESLHEMEEAVRAHGSLAGNAGKKIHALLDDALDIARKARKEKSHFSNNLKRAGHLQKDLHAASSEMIDLLHEVEKALHEARSEKAQQIMVETQKRLEGAGVNIAARIEKAVKDNEIKMPKSQIEELREHFNSKHYRKKKRGRVS